MSKYSHDFKLEVVKYCLNTNLGFLETANHFNIPSKTTVKKWVKKYQEHGISGLIRNKNEFDGTFTKCSTIYV